MTTDASVTTLIGPSAMSSSDSKPLLAEEFSSLEFHIDHVLWDQRQAQHEARVGLLACDYLERRAKNEKHPVWDFLFTYYSFSPKKLLTWVPGLQQREELLHLSSHQTSCAHRTYIWTAPKSRDLHLAQWVAALCRNILQRPARFGCHGLHEWAMVYQLDQEEIRHSQCPLRLQPEQIAKLIESQPLTCTHYDAFRFFTSPAIPLNAFHPTLESRPQLEQAGCLHANMDLYKWAFKLWPWIGSDLVADAFELACKGRDLDMRASPYDLVEFGFDPIPIETESGREQYRREQQILTNLATPVRQRLLDACENMIAVYQD